MGMISLTLVRTDIDDTLLARLTAALAPAEQARAARFRQAADRRRHVVARSVLKTTLAERLGRAPHALRFETGPFGKPALAADLAARDAAPLHFNLSHSGDLALIALAPVPVGVDLERDTPVDAQALAQAWFTPAEQARLAQGQDDFLSLWTAREAVLKAAGTGLSADPMAFRVPPADRRSTFAPVQVLSADAGVAGMLVAALALSGVDGIPPAMTAPYRAAVAVRGHAMPVVLAGIDANAIAARGTLRAAACAGALCTTH